MSIKYKRTCRTCGAQWIGVEGFRLGWTLFDSLFMAITKGSMIDMDYNIQQRIKKARTCPNCNSSVYYQEECDKRSYITKFAKKNAKKSKRKQAVPEDNVEIKERSFKWSTLFLISLFLGVFGIDRFYVGKKGSGALKLLTFGGFFIWWIIDLFIIASGKFKDSYGKEVKNTLGQKISSLFIAALLAMILISSFIKEPKTSLNAEENLSNKNWNSMADTKWYNASQKEFTITTAEALAGFAKLVNDGNDFKNKTVKLGTNIMLNDTTNWRGWQVNKQLIIKWTPIGRFVTATKEKPPSGHKSFRGTFDGSGFVVSGIYINNSDNCQGLFGMVENGTIKNLGVLASHIEVKGEASIGGLVGLILGGTISDSYFVGNVVTDIVGVGVGGLAGSSMQSTIINSYFTGMAIGNSGVGGLVGTFADTNGTSAIKKSYSTGTVKGIENHVGGLVGKMVSGSIINSYSAATVEGGKENAGGLVGENWGGNISNSYSTNTVTGQKMVGGFIGGNEESTITNSYSIGAVTGKDGVGGFIGANNKGKISNSYSTGTVKGVNYVGGFIGASSGNITNSYYNNQTSGQVNDIGINNGKGKGVGKTTEQMKQKANFAGWDFDKIWGMNGEINNGYPYLLKNKGQSN